VYFSDAIITQASQRLHSAAEELVLFALTCGKRLLLVAATIGSSQLCQCCHLTNGAKLLLPHIYMLVTIILEKVTNMVYMARHKN